VLLTQKQNRFSFHCWCFTCIYL